jgi:hypothetical protein
MTLEEARKRVAESKGARWRELTARHLLLHLELLQSASAAEIQAFTHYVKGEKWRGLYFHDRAMYLTLRRQAELHAAATRQSVGVTTVKNHPI